MSSTSKFEYIAFIDFRKPGSRYIRQRMDHPTGVAFDLIIDTGEFGDIDAYIFQESTSTDHQLKSIDLSLYRVSEVNGRNVAGARIAHTITTDIDDGESLILIPKAKRVLYFKVHCIAEVEKMSFQADLTSRFLKNPDNPDFADVTLECGGVELKCHSFVLAARSYVFATALTRAQSQKIKIDEMDIDVLRQMIRFNPTFFFCHGSIPFHAVLA